MDPAAADAYWMLQALEAARPGIGYTSPNPPVGAALVRDGRLLTTGFHRRAGAPHAEIEALENLQSPQAARGATLYVTLEPCSSHGRTPPCCDTIRKAGISRVVYGSTDPDPRNRGRSRILLEAAGIKVVAGVLQADCDALIRVFRHWTQHRCPYVIAKAALSLDGRLTRPPGEPQWLSSPASRADAQWLRRQSDAILVGAATVRRDNPRLTLRSHSPGATKEQPWRVVLTRSGNLPTGAALFSDSHAHRTLVLLNQTIPGLLETLASRHVDCLLVEGGGQVLGSFLAAEAVQELHLYISPLLCGGPNRIRYAPGNARSPITAIQVSRRQIGNDLKLEVHLPSKTRADAR
ncbi:MAG TPA: bifunctional diaminohydroxyphosphoribosylaminopyrimidine deaminase/5-amino-6-(5-phosphoribosylamino)uracil reductase RibD [Verrucomicrobiales bacterium]|nr:bifunctional diaminohydroxyphosphoribosylaminopyrimidine deaminase/5-amino-6-(5-phosphoribosylamino)uracil reductase RibD [Verrucomicrobiales bacterium]